MITPVIGCLQSLDLSSLKLNGMEVSLVSELDLIPDLQM